MEEYLYMRSLQPNKWIVHHLIDGKCVFFPGTVRDTIFCSSEQEAYSCAMYYAITFGGTVTRGSK